MNTYVWVDAWQQRCCGDDFRVGGAVEWGVVRQDGGDEWTTLLLGEAWGRKVRYREEHHGDVDPDLMLPGAVVSIRVVTCDRVLGKVDGPGPGQAWIPVPGSGRLRDVAVADAWEPESNPQDHSTSFDGWIVELATDVPA